MPVEQPVGHSLTYGAAHEDHPRERHRLACSINHEDIGAMYLVFAVVAGLVGVFLSLTTGPALMQPGMRIFGDPHTLNDVVSGYGLIVAFFMIIPALIGGFGSWFVPLMIGAPDMAFPRMHNIAFWLLPLSLALLVLALFVEVDSGDSGVGRGWATYDSRNLAIGCAVISIYIAGLSSILSAINFITTIFTMRTPRMALHEMPPFVWSILVATFLLMLWLSVVAAAVAVLFTDGHVGPNFIKLADVSNAVQHEPTFWLLGWPEVYILILPSFGIISQVISTFSRKPVLGYLGMVYAMVAIGVFGFIVWAHHLFARGPSTDTDAYFALVTVVIAVPTTIIIILGIATMMTGTAKLRAPTLWAIGFIFLFTAGGATAATRANVDFNMTPLGTYYVVAHAHYVLALCAVFAIFAGWYYWFPKIFGLLYNETLAKLHFWIMFIGVNLFIFTPYIPSPAGILRRYIDYPDADARWQQLVSIGSYISILGLVIFFVCMAEALIRRKVSNQNPWNATTLEWTASPRARFGRIRRFQRRSAARASTPLSHSSRPQA